MNNNICVKLIKINQINVFQYSVRNFRGIKGKLFGKPPGEAKDIKYYFEKQRFKDPTIYYKVNIGLPTPLLSKEERIKQLKLEKKNKQNASCSAENISLDDINDVWFTAEAPFHIKKVADHYNIFSDLFGDAYFYPFVRLQIAYKINNEEYVPVHRGNIVKPNEACNEPLVRFNAKPDKKYTLVLSTPDGHLSKENAEYVHWLVGNIPGGEVTKGEIIKPFLQPFPVKGIGYLRFIYVLYEQEGSLDYSSLKSDLNRISLDDRTFSSYDFYKLRQDQLTPVGLVFHQSDWDWSVHDFFHKKLCMPEPIFEYDFEEPLEKQLWYPDERPFNTYMDRYRDPKQISKELLVKKLKTHHPFKKPDPPLKYPAALVPIETRGMPSWKQTEVRKEKCGWGVVNFNKDMLDPK